MLKKNSSGSDVWLSSRLLKVIHGTYNITTKLVVWSLPNNNYLCAGSHFADKRKKIQGSIVPSPLV